MRFVKILTSVFLAACLTACSNKENDMDGANYWDAEGNPITFSGNVGTGITEADDIGENESRAENEIKLETVEIIPQCKPSMGFEFGLPEGWTYTVVHTDDIPTSSTSAYIIPKSMEGLADGGVLTIEYLKYGFAVCGTGLTEKNIDFNGYSARQGFYDGNEQWSYISLNGEYDGCVVHCSPTVATDYAEIIDAVLPTIKFKYYDE